MSSSPSDFDQLKRLLSLKRREMPPPGYFSHFSDRVMARIEAVDPGSRPSWWQRLWDSMDASPLMAFGYGGAVVGLLLVGLGVLDSVEPGNTVTASVVPNPWFRPAADADTGPSVFSDTAAPHSSIARTESSTSITPVMSRSTVPESLFDVNRLRTQPAGYTFH